MTSEEDFLFRPVIAGLCKYESLKDCTLDLFDIVKMSEAMDVQYENQNRVRDKK